MPLISFHLPLALMSHTEGETLHSSVSKKNSMKKKASFSVASVSCLTGAVIRSTSIEAVGINVTHRRRSTAFVNVYTFKQTLLKSINPNIRPKEHLSYLTCEVVIKISLSSFVFCTRCGMMKNWRKAKSVADYTELTKLTGGLHIAISQTRCKMLVLFERVWWLLSLR